MIVTECRDMVGFTFRRFHELMYFLKPNLGLIRMFTFEHEFFVAFINFNSKFKS